MHIATAARIVRPASAGVEDIQVLNWASPQILSGFSRCSSSYFSLAKLFTVGPCVRASPTAPARELFASLSTRRSRRRHLLNITVNPSTSDIASSVTRARMGDFQATTAMPATIVTVCTGPLKAKIWQYSLYTLRNWIACEPSAPKYVLL